ncbi:MAG: 5-bromo-4-chloroindolyl phosphate hydrolysis family protein [Solibacillus sp.]
MLNALHFTTRHVFNAFFGFAIFVIAIAQFNTLFSLLSIPLAIATYFISNKLILLYQRSKQSKQFGLTRSEFEHIESQLKQSRTQLANLTQQYIRVRSVKSFKLINDMNKLAKRILNIVQTNPQKFYAVEDFFYAHLPSAVELTDKYTLLTKEQISDPAIHLALEDTRRTLKDLYETMEDDLKQALASDIEGLKIELDFAKLANDKRKERVKLGGE